MISMSRKTPRHYNVCSWWIMYCEFVFFLFSNRICFSDYYITYNGGYILGILFVMPIVYISGLNLHQVYMWMTRPPVSSLISIPYFQHSLLFII